MEMLAVEMSVAGMLEMKMSVVVRDVAVVMLAGVMSGMEMSMPFPYNPFSGFSRIGRSNTSELVTGSAKSKISPLN